MTIHVTKQTFILNNHNDRVLFTSMRLTIKTIIYFIFSPQNYTFVLTIILMPCHLE